MRRSRFIGGIGLFALAAGAPSLADQYPDKVVTIIHPFTAGGGSDVIARVVTKQMALDSGRSFILENRTGAGGQIGYETAARAPADGYTLVTSETTYDMLPGLYGNQLAYHYDDLVPVATWAEAPMVVVVSPRLKVTTLKVLIDMAKAAPGKLNYGSSGIGSINHIVTELLLREAQIRMTHVPYRGMGDAMTGFLSGSVDVLILSPITVIGNAKSGKMIPLAVASTKRLAQLPDVPTAVEAGLPHFIASNWFGLMAPKGTPADIVSWLNAAVDKAIAAPEVKERFAALGVIPFQNTPVQMATMMRNELRRWTSVIEAARIVPD